MMKKGLGERGHCSRRDFIKLAAGAAAVGFLAGPGSVLASMLPGNIACGRCGSVFQAGHEHSEGDVSGVFCPACGVELKRLEYLGKDRALVNRKGNPRRKTKQVLWNWAQVPFPNRKMVARTDKAGAIFKDVRI